MAFIQNISRRVLRTGGWEKDFSRIPQQKKIHVLQPNEIIEIDDGSLDSPVLRDLVKRKLIAVINVDNIPQITNDSDFRDLDVIEETLQGLIGGTIPSAPGGPAGGDLSGTYPDPEVAAVSALEAGSANDVLFADGLGGFSVGPLPTPKRMFMSFDTDKGVKSGVAEQYLTPSSVVNTFDVGIVLPEDVTLVGIAFSSEAADASRNFDVEVVSDPTGTPTLIGSGLTISNVTKARRNDLSAAIGSLVDWGVRVRRTSGSGSSTFNNLIVVIEVEV